MMEITGGDRDLTEKEEAKLAKERDAPVSYTHLGQGTIREVAEAYSA